MKIALLFSGQFRDISNELFRHSLSNLTKDLDYDIYTYIWEEPGKSLNHANSIPEISTKINSPLLLSNLLEDFNLKKIKAESFRDFKKNLKSPYKNIIESNEFHFGTIHTIPQIYTLSKCFNLLKDNIQEYDLIFRCRLDCLFIHPLKIFDLEKLIRINQVKTINFGRSFYPNRIYDIFFGGSSSSMSFLGSIWQELPNLIVHKFDNKLDKRDSCRVLYLSAIKNGIKVGSFDTRICDVFRNIRNNNYEKYILSMHFISLKSIYKIKNLNFYFKWCKLRNFSVCSILIVLIKTILLIPFSYIKRISFRFRKKY